MPLTKLGKEILKKFEKEYGLKKGKSRFYAYVNKYPNRVKGWHTK